MDERKITAQRLREMKQRGEKIVALTAYDFFTAKIMDEVGIDLILVGDSVGMAVLGYENTVPVTLDEMLHHTRAVARARPRSLLVGDLPFMTYSTVERALESAGKLVQAGAEAVKIEGGETVVEQVVALAKTIPVLGHVGLLPQSILETGGYKVQGRTPASAAQLLRDAQALEAAGAFAVVIECTVAEVARQITGALRIPTIGIGAGNGCDGQILVSNDMLGQFTWFTPKHVKRYANLAEEMRKAFAAYKHEVETGQFPGKEQSF
ncbi:MAG: 3-methyl-2-oxobutanoate hydroxymethyltransferase [Verrucomicrobiae bacterium]|nr:3-methyl-2-oxobutanoate hydroxymethyltransferase [Verrucomicrobiae bacterium]